jgi:putative effector of murein hydrolase
MTTMLTTLYNTFFHGLLFAVVLSVCTYEIGILLHKKFPFAIVNPLLIATILSIAVLELCSVPFSEYKKGGDLLSMWLGPATEILALNIYNKREVLKKNIVPVITASIVGAVTCVSVVYGLGKLFKLDEVIIRSLYSKSVTTPIALSLSKDVGGIQAVTMSGVLITGIFGGMFAPQLVKLFHITEPVAAGLAIGTSSHAVGTSTALQMGETEGAMSSIAIGCMGLATTLVFIFI